MMVLAPHTRNQSIHYGRRLSGHMGVGSGYNQIDTIAVSFTARTIHSPFFALTLVIEFIDRVIGHCFG
jgi:hypothetical protein